MLDDDDEALSAPLEASQMVLMAQDTPRIASSADVEMSFDTNVSKSFNFSDMQLN
jgi:hypothetical protein